MIYRSALTTSGFRARARRLADRMRSLVRNDLVLVMIGFRSRRRHSAANPTRLVVTKKAETGAGVIVGAGESASRTGVACSHQAQL